MKKESSKRRRRTPAERAQILDEYHQSGLTQKVFAAQADLSCSALSSWLRQALTHADSGLDFLLGCIRAAQRFRQIL
jgi:transposase-like protein